MLISMRTEDNRRYKSERGSLGPRVCEVIMHSARHHQFSATNTSYLLGALKPGVESPPTIQRTLLYFPKASCGNPECGTFPGDGMLDPSTQSPQYTLNPSRQDRALHLLSAKDPQCLGCPARIFNAKSRSNGKEDRPCRHSCEARDCEV